MGDDQDPEGATEPEQQEPILRLRMLGVVEQQGVLVGEDCFGFAERGAVLAPVRRGFPGVPIRTEARPCRNDTYGVRTASTATTPVFGDWFRTGASCAEGRAASSDFMFGLARC